MNIMKKFLSICRENVLIDIMRYYDNHQIATDTLFIALKYDKITADVFSFLLSKTYDDIKMCTLMFELCENNRLDLMKIMVGKYHFNINYDKIIETATMLNYYDIVSWAFSRPQYVDSLTMMHIAMHADIHIYQKIAKTCECISENIILASVKSNVDWIEKLLWYKTNYNYNVKTISNLINNCDDERYKKIVEIFNDFIKDKCDIIVDYIYKIPKLIQLSNKFNINIDVQLSKLKCDNFHIIANFYSNDEEKYQLLLNNYTLHNNASMIKCFLEWCESQSIILNNTVIIDSLLTNKISRDTYYGKWMVNYFNIEHVNINDKIIIITNSNSKSKKRKRDDDMCCICLEESNTYTNCNHIICTCCLVQMTKNSCPICRSNINNIIKYQ